MKHKTEICDFCHIGEIVQQRLTYTERFQEELILISNIPGTVCNYCGDKRYNPFVMNTLRQLLWARMQRPRGSRGSITNYGYPIDPQSHINKGQFPSGGN